MGDNIGTDLKADIKKMIIEECQHFVLRRANGQCEGVKKESLEELAKKATLFGDIGTFKKLSQVDVLKILEMAY